MSAHPHVPYDAALISDIAARMDLREPNREALEAVATSFDEAAGERFEIVCDLATAVGKTYLAGGLIEYLALSGVRHFLIVVPGRTILDKTVNNLTLGHPKSILGGMQIRPLIVTAENFNTGTVAAALRDDDQVKLFVFTVQSLIRPRKSDRRLRKYQEWIGEDLYAYLKRCDDLVIVADEHHVYSEKAETFHDAVRDLDPMGLVGLTATPAKTDQDKVIYRYPLARAIADRYVKTPVLVGRKDDARGVEVQLRDGLLLLEAKQKAADAYAAATGRDRVNAVMFVVSDTIDNANAVAEVLRKPGLFADEYEERVLVVHSDAPDDALARLDSVEDPDSPVRVIVSVAMLKEGWDVKNIYVICSFRPSISEALTEQTLGRGLRLPWGEYTGMELLDTVEVLSHERYEQLLAKAGVLLEGLTEKRITTKPVISPEDPLVDDAVIVTPATPGSGDADQANAEPAPTTTPDAETTTEQPAMRLTSLEERSQQAQTQAEATSQPVPPNAELRLPHVVRTVGERSFSLSDVPSDSFFELGHRLASAASGTLNRKLLTVVEDSDGGYKLVPTDAAEIVEASAPELPYGDAKRALREAILGLDVVEADRASINAATRLAEAVVEGAGSEGLLASYLNAASTAAARIINAHYRAAPAPEHTTVDEQTFGPTRVSDRPIEKNRYGPFSRKVAYAGWQRSLHPLNWFDSTPERTFANLADSEEGVGLWARIQRGELRIHSLEGTYTPDFYVRYDGEHYLVEVKADRQVDSPEVQAKKAAAVRWARYVTDHGGHGTWHYVLVSESVLKTAKTFAAGLSQSAT